MSHSTARISLAGEYLAASKESLLETLLYVNKIPKLESLNDVTESNI
jgi:hypothetical protein